MEKRKKGDMRLVDEPSDEELVDLDEMLNEELIDIELLGAEAEEMTAEELQYVGASSDDSSSSDEFDEEGCEDEGADHEDDGEHAESDGEGEKGVGGAKEDDEEEGFECEDEMEEDLMAGFAPSSSREPKYWDKSCSLEKIDLQIGDKFVDADWLRVVLQNYAAEKGFNYTYSRNQKSDGIGAVCKLPNCGFYIWCGYIKAEECLAIKTFRPKHNCQTKKKGESITARSLGYRYANYINEHASINHEEFKRKIKGDLQIKLKEGKITRVIREGRQIHEEEIGLQYGMLKRYGELLMKSNPGTQFKILTDGKNPPRFKRLYLRYGAQKLGFINGCRPFIALDGCHLKSPHGGILLGAVARDANDGMFPLAVAVVEQETKESWKWFVDELFGDIGDGEDRRWVFMSDKQKGLVEVFKERPNVEHRHCVRHLFENWFKSFKSQQMKKMFWKCSQATSGEEFEGTMEELRKKDLKAYKWLRDRPAENWCIGFFNSYCKSAAQTNNISETFNSWIKIGRAMPILTFLEYYRKKLMSWFYRKGCLFEEDDDKLLPRIQKRLTENLRIGAKLKVETSTIILYEVTSYNEEFEVNLMEGTCTCLLWQLSGLPCKHVAAVLIKAEVDPSPFVDSYYKMQYFKKAYEGNILPVIGVSKCKNVQKEGMLLPPIVRKQPGRPRKNRIKGCMETEGKLQKKPKKEGQDQENTGTMSRRGLVMTCSICKNVGHNKRTCSTKDFGVIGNTSVQAKGKEKAKEQQDASVPVKGKLPVRRKPLDTLEKSRKNYQVRVGVTGSEKFVKHILDKKREASFARIEKERLRKRLKRQEAKEKAMEQQRKDSESVESVESVEPVESAEPAESVELVEPVEPAEPVSRFRLVDEDDEDIDAVSEGEGEQPTVNIAALLKSFWDNMSQQP